MKASDPTLHAIPRLRWFIIGALTPAMALAAPPPAPTAPIPEAPGTGQLLREVPAPVLPAAATQPDLNVKEPAADENADVQAFEVREIVITGNTRIPTDELKPLVADGEGRQLSLADLNRLARKITDAYRAKGYLLARAYVPAQTVEGGKVTITVLEATYGKVSIRNEAEVPARVVESTLAGTDETPGVVNGAPVLQMKLERTLLLLSDMPGRTASATLKPGTEPGSSDLQLDLGALKSFGGSVGVDNYGNRFTGRARVNATLDVDNPLHLADQLTFNGTSAGPGLNYGRVAYILPIRGVGTQIGAYASALDYRLVNGADGLGAHGNASVAGVTLQRNLMRSTRGNISLQLDVAETTLQDRIDTAGIRDDRHTNDIIGSVNGVLIQTTGTTAFNLILNLGRVGFDDAAARINDVSGPHTDGNFFRYAGSLGRVERLTAQDEIAASLTLQGSNANLDTSEQFYLGGPNSVRAYDTAAVSGDQGTFGMIEWRHALPQSWPGHWQFTLFGESGHAELRKNAFGSGTNDATLSGAGAGINWAGAGGCLVTFSLATPLGPKPEVLESRSSLHAWLQGQVAF